MSLILWLERLAGGIFYLGGETCRISMIVNMGLAKETVDSLVKVILLSPILFCCAEVIC